MTFIYLKVPFWSVFSNNYIEDMNNIIKVDMKRIRYVLLCRFVIRAHGFLGDFAIRLYMTNRHFSSLGARVR